MLLGVTGCAVLNQPVVEIAPRRLTCVSNPEFVDGNLETSSSFVVNGFVRKAYQMLDGPDRQRDDVRRSYVTRVEGSRRTEAVIRLDVPTYVSYVDVYSGSRRISNFVITTTMEDPPRFDVAFRRVPDKQHEDIEGLKPVRFHINRKVLYLRLRADCLEDRQNSVRSKNSVVEIPLKGAILREVRFFGR